MLYPGEPERAAYEDLVAEKGISGAEVIRQALMEMHARHRQAHPASKQLKEAG